MMGKRNFFVLALILLVFVPFVSAQTTFPEVVNGFVDGLTKIIEPIAKILLGDIAGSGDFSSSDVLWSKSLFLILIFSVIYVVSQRIDFLSSNSTAHFIISFVVALLGTRWLGDARFIQALLLPYSALGIAISAVIPFIAWFMIVNVGMKGATTSVRRIFWTLFGVVFLFLWLSRITELATVAMYWIYPATFVAAILMAIQDGTIRRFQLKLELENVEKNTAGEAIIELKKKIGELDLLVKDGIITSVEAYNRKLALEKRIAYISKHS